MKKCAIIIAAYRCADYIMDCVNSIDRQIETKDWEYELRIGVDGCLKTADVLDKNGISYYWSDINVGAYVMRNSLIHTNYVDMYAYFDADDVMLDNYMKANIKMASLYKLAMPRKINVNKVLRPLESCRLIDQGSGGAMTFTHDVLMELGGYNSYRCSSDCDFLNRASRLGIRRFLSDKPFYLRRIHSESLTHRKETGVHSLYRETVVEEMKELIKKGYLKIDPEVTSLSFHKAN